MKFIKFLWRLFVPGVLIFGIVTIFTTFDFQYTKVGEVTSDYVVRTFYTSTTNNKCIKYTFTYKDYKFGQLWDSEWKYAYEDIDHWVEKEIDMLYKGFVVERMNWLPCVCLFLGAFLCPIFGPATIDDDDLNHEWNWLYRFKTKGHTFKDVYSEVKFTITKISINLIATLCYFFGYQIPPTKVHIYSGKYMWELDNGEVAYSLIETIKYYRNKKNIIN